MFVYCLFVVVVVVFWGGGARSCNVGLFVDSGQAGAVFTLFVLRRDTWLMMMIK